jgi:hypothetical protein
VPFDFFNDVFLLHLPLEAPKGIFQRLALLQFYFSQPITPPIVFQTCRPARMYKKFRSLMAKEFPISRGQGIDIIGA